MTSPVLAPAPSGTDPSGTRTAVGSDDQCSYIENGVRCTEPATDTVFGELFCSPHADITAGIA